MYQAILFDLDGTLLNTNALIIHTFQYTLEKHLGIRAKPEELTPYFGEPLRVTLSRFAPKNVDELVATYRAYNALKHDELTTLFPHVQETLSQLHKMGIKLGVVTSKFKPSALKGLELFRLTSYFEVIIGLDDTPEHKPHPAPIEKALQELKVKASQTLMVGDSPMDLRCARNAGVDSALVSYSLLPPEVLAAEKPTYVLKDLRDLITILQYPRQKASNK